MAQGNHTHPRCENIKQTFQTISKKQQEHRAHGFLLGGKISRQKTPKIPNDWTQKWKIQVKGLGMEWNSPKCEISVKLLCSKNSGIQLTLEQHRFELWRSAYLWLFLSVDFSSKYILQHYMTQPHRWLDLQMENQGCGRQIVTWIFLLHQAIGTSYLQAIQESAVYIQWNIVQPFKKKKKTRKAYHLW